MALRSCKECGREVSGTARACPGCGYERPESWLSIVVKALICTAVVVFVYSWYQFGGAR